MEFLPMITGMHGEQKYNFSSDMQGIFWTTFVGIPKSWGIFLSVVFIGLVFIVLECCHVMAMDEVPQIRQDFEILLRTLERKSRQPYSSMVIFDTVRTFWTIPVGVPNCPFYFSAANFSSAALGVSIPNFLCGHISLKKSILLCGRY